MKNYFFTLFLIIVPFNFCIDQPPGHPVRNTFEANYGLTNILGWIPINKSEHSQWDSLASFTDNVATLSRSRYNYNLNTNAGTGLIQLVGTDMDNLSREREYFSRGTNAVYEDLTEWGEENWISSTNNKQLFTHIQSHPMKYRPGGINNPASIHGVSKRNVSYFLDQSIDSLLLSEVGIGTFTTRQFHKDSWDATFKDKYNIYAPVTEAELGSANTFYHTKETVRIDELIIKTSTTSSPAAYTEILNTTSLGVKPEDVLIDFPNLCTVKSTTDGESLIYSHTGTLPTDSPVSRLLLLEPGTLIWVEADVSLAGQSTAGIADRADYKYCWYESPVMGRYSFSDGIFAVRRDSPSTSDQTGFTQGKDSFAGYMWNGIMTGEQTPASYTPVSTDTTTYVLEFQLPLACKDETGSRFCFEFGPNGDEPFSKFNLTLEFDQAAGIYINYHLGTSAGIVLNGSPTGSSTTSTGLLIPLQVYNPNKIIEVAIDGGANCEKLLSPSYVP